MKHIVKVQYSLSSSNLILSSCNCKSTTPKQTIMPIMMQIRNIRSWSMALRFFTCTYGASKPSTSISCLLQIFITLDISSSLPPFLISCNSCLVALTSDKRLKRSRSGFHSATLKSFVNLKISIIIYHMEIKSNDWSISSKSIIHHICQMRDYSLLLQVYQ